MIGKIERQRIKEIITGMCEEQLRVVVEDIPSNLLFLELMRRDAEKDTVIKQIKEATQILKGDE